MSVLSLPISSITDLKKKKNERKEKEKKKKKT